MESSYSLDDLDFILRHHKEYTAKEMSDRLGIKIGIIWGIGYRNAIEYKRSSRKVKQSPEPEAGLRHHVPPDLLPDPEPPKLVRPAAVYSNHGFQDVKRKYL